MYVGTLPICNLKGQGNPSSLWTCRALPSFQTDRELSGEAIFTITPASVLGNLFKNVCSQKDSRIHRWGSFSHSSHSPHQHLHYYCYLQPYYIKCSFEGFKKCYIYFISEYINNIFFSQRNLVSRLIYISYLVKKGTDTSTQIISSYFKCFILI